MVFAFVHVDIFQQHFENSVGGVELSVIQTSENYFLYFEVCSLVLYWEPVKVIEKFHSEKLDFHIL